MLGLFGTSSISVIHAHILLLFLCLVLFSTTAALHKWLPPPSTCEPTHKPAVSDADKPLPTFPQQYSMSIEANILHDGWSYQMDEYFDEVINRAAVTVTFNATTTHTIFKIEPFEMCDIYPDGTCNVGRDIVIHEYVFVGMYKNTPLPAKSYFGHVFDKTQHGVFYVGQNWVRGIDVDHWTSCQEWKSLEAKVQIDYYFTLPDYLTAWGQGQRPVRVVVNGSSGRFSSDQIPTNHNFQLMYDVTSFRKGLAEDMTVFQIPNDVVCKGLKDSKVMPDLPDQFEMDIKMTSSVLGNSVPLQQKLRYDWTNQLTEIVREFPVNQGIPGDTVRHKDISHNAKGTSKQFEQDRMVVRRVSWVEDFHTGLQYITEKNNNTCRVRHLPDTSMSHGNALLRISNEQHYGGEIRFTYQGQSIFQGLPAESWGMEADGMMQKVFFLLRIKGSDRPVDKEGLTPEEVMELAMGMDRIRLAPFPKFPILLGIVLRNHTSIDSRHMPSLVKNLISAKVLHWFNGRLRHFKDLEEEDENKLVLHKFLAWTRLQEIQNEHMGELDMRVNHFQHLHTNSDMFHVSQCYSPDQVTRVSLTVRTFYATNVQHDPMAFSIAMRTSVAKSMGVSTLQISDLTPSAFRDMTLVNFNLLGSPPVTEIRNKQLNIEYAKEKLKEVIKNGIGFSVKYVSGTQSFLVDKDLYSLDFSLEDTPIVQKYFLAEKKAAKGFSGGMIAGAVIASIIITCAVTVLAIVIYLKHRKQSDFPMVPYSIVKEVDFRS